MKRRNQVFSTILAVALAMNMTVMPVYATETDTSDSNISTTENVGANDSSDVQGDVSGTQDNSVSVDNTSTNDNFLIQSADEGNNDNTVDNDGGSGKEGTEDSVSNPDEANTDVQTENGTNIGETVPIEVNQDQELDNSGIMLLEEEEKEYYYVTMNIPYSDFYAAENVSEQVDVVSTATTNKFKDTDRFTKGTYHNDTEILGVTYPVKVDANTYEKLNKDIESSSDYYISEYEGTPETYKELTISEDGKYIFSEARGDDKNSDSLSVTNLTTDSKYGNYQFELGGVSTEGTINGEEATIYSVILSTQDGESYPLYALYNMWLGGKGNVKVAWSVTGAPDVLKKDNQSVYYKYSMNGKTIENVKLITSAGIYSFKCNSALTPYYEDEISALAVNKNTIVLYNLPDDIKDAKVRVYYTTTVEDGKKVTTDLVTDASIVNGTVILDSEMINNQTYTVYVTSDNYAQIKYEKLSWDGSEKDITVQEPDVEPTPSTGSSSSESSSSSSDDEEDTPTPTETTQPVSVEPSIITADGTVVTGWNNVIETAINNAILLATNTTQNSDSELYQYGSVSSSATHVTVDINLANVTNLEIPKTAVETMKQSGADYNFYYKNIAITIPSTSLSNWEGSIDLNLEIENKNFNADFDVFSLKKDKDTPIAAGTIINAVLSPAKAGKVAYVFNNSENGGYELAEAVQISEIGTIMLAIDGIDEFLILY